MDNNQKENSPIQGHEYDGIHELDNPAPFWWQLFFALSIGFAIVYFAYYEFGNGPSSDAELKQNLSEISVLQAMNRPAGPDAKALLAVFADAGRVKSGKDVFVSKCASCHQADGGGLIGPNLVDKFWIHGKGKLTDIYTVVKSGVPDKGMPPWGGVISDADLANVVAYVKALQGAKVANAKAPQGLEATKEESAD